MSAGHPVVHGCANRVTHSDMVTIGDGIAVGHAAYNLPVLHPIVIARA